MVSRNVTKQTAHMPSHQLQERWLLVDANDQIVGRLATKLAVLLMGKDQASYNPAVDSKTNLIVINAEKVKFSGNKTEDKKYYKHSGYLGNLKTTTPERILDGKNPQDVLKKAIYGMLPKNKLRPVMMDRLRLFVGTEHPHAGQSPVEVKI